MSRKFHLAINCDNAAFDDGAIIEIKRALKLTRWLIGNTVHADNEGRSHMGNINDSNGNLIGSWHYEVTR